MTANALREAQVLPAVADRAETLYRDLRPLLLFVACRKFSVPEADAESLLQEAMLSYISCDASIADPRAWLVGAVCNASRHYWRSRIRRGEVEGASPPEEVPYYPVERLEREMLIRQLLARLRPRHREVLRLHYFDRLTERDLALHYGISIRSARKRIGLALRSARDVLAASRRGLPSPQTKV